MHVRPGVARVLEHAEHPGVGQPAPTQLPGPHPAVGAQREPAPGERGDHPVGRPARGERGEQVPDRGLHLGVRVDDHRAGLVVHVADRQRGAQLAARGRGAFGRLQALGHHVQLHLAHRGLQPEQHPVVDIGGIVDAVGVDQQRFGDRGELHQPRHLRVGAGQPGDLQPEDRPDLAGAHPRHQLGEPGPGHAPPARHPQVGVDHHHRLAGPAQPHRLLDQPVLAHRRLGVLPHLRHRRLPQIHHRQPIQLGPNDFRRTVDHPDRLPAHRSPCSPPPAPPRHVPPRPARSRARRPPVTAARAAPAARR